MAQGLVNYSDAGIAARVDEVMVTFAHVKRLLDRMVALRAGGSDYTSIAVAAGCTPATSAEGLKLFDDIDAALAGLTTAYNALSQLDKNAL